MPTVNDQYPTKPQHQMSDEELKMAAIAKYTNSNPGVSTEAKSSFPTEIVELPSRGLLYPENHPLASGKIEMKYMTAKEEDILTNQSYIKQGVVLDKLFQSLIVTPVDYDDLLIGDKNAVMVASRILGYGKDYETEVINPSGTKQKVAIDLTKLSDKEIDETLYTRGVSEFELTLPASKRMVTVQLITNRIQKKIDTELKGLAKLKQQDSTLTTMLKHIIVALDGDRDQTKIRKFVDSELLAIDSRAIRTYVKSITPDIDLSYEFISEEDGEPFRGTLAIGLDFFWPDSKL
jgi:hypothetical protein